MAQSGTKSLSEKTPKADEALKYQFERLSVVANELLPLIKASWEEVTYKDKFNLVFDIDWDRAFHLDMLGVLHLLTVRDNGRLVGYVLNQVFNPILFTTTKFSYVEAFFLDPLYRSGWNGVNLLKKNEKGMRMLGVKIIKLGLYREDFNFIIKRLGYEFTEHCALKYIGD
jgi:hypothetical protein